MKVVAFIFSIKGAIMPPVRINIYDTGQERELIIPDKYAEKLKDEPLYKIIKDMKEELEKNSKLGNGEKLPVG